MWNKQLGPGEINASVYSHDHGGKLENMYSKSFIHTLKIQPFPTLLDKNKNVWCGLQEIPQQPLTRANSYPCVWLSMCSYHLFLFCSRAIAKVSIVHLLSVCWLRLFKSQLDFKPGPGILSRKTFLNIPMYVTCLKGQGHRGSVDRYIAHLRAVSVPDWQTALPGRTKWCRKNLSNDSDYHPSWI